ncbi:MAG: type II toxin-antitoxin system RelE/ParE family toxin [Betaproteobacteria bacterium]|nr:type II toxin-antitoxin system RelE/ParE family toxin [Betaproteobacteria bacterium]
MLALRFAKPAIKALLKMPAGIAGRMRAELDAVVADPTAYRGDWKPLQGSDFWRLRVGDWRAICDLRDAELVLLVVKIAPRGDAYK